MKEKTKKPVAVNERNIAFCGLYCEACHAYRKGKCPGCAGNDRATWCKIRTCCMQMGHGSCADCVDVIDLRQCRIYHNPVSRIIGFVLRSNRMACISYIRNNGYAQFAAYMAEKGKQSMPR